MTNETLHKASEADNLYTALFGALSSNSILLKPNAPIYTIVAVTDAYLNATGTRKKDLVGKGIFEAFPANNEDPDHTGESDLYKSYHFVLEHKKPHYLPVQRYDLLNETGGYDERYWRAHNRPVFSSAGEITYIIHTAEDITDQIIAEKKEEAHQDLQKAFIKIEESEAALKLSTERFDLVAKATQDAIWDWDLTTNKVWWNESFKELFGYEASEIESNVDSWYNRLHPDDSEWVVNGIHEVIDNRSQNWSAEYRFRKKDGSYVTVFDRGYALYDKEGKPYRMLGSMQDITERKRSSEAISKSEAKYRNLFESMDQGYCTLEIIFEGDICVDYRYLETNPAFERHLGMKGALGKTIREIAPNIEPKWFQFYGSVALTGNPIRVEEESKAFNKWFEVYAIRLESIEDRKVGVFFTDITERKKTEESLRQSEERSRLAIASAQLGTYEINVVEQSIIYSSRTAEILGLDPTKKWSYQSFINTVHPEDREVRNKALENAKRTGDVFYEARIVHPDQSIRWVRLNGRLLNQEQQPMIIGTVMDITTEKRAAEVLEQKVQERTLALEKANQELKRSNQNLEEFAHAASHDMKEPIRKVLTFSDRLKRSLEAKMSETEKQLFSRVEDATQRMKLLVEDLLEYSHVSERPHEMEDVDLNKKIEKVLVDLELLIDDKKGQIKVAPLPVVKGYRRQLQQLFQNLIGNALKYNKPGVPPQILITSKKVIGHEVEVNLLPEQLSQNFYLIQIVDNGIGFEPHYADKIFGMFQRLHSKAQYPGTGVGLSIARKVVENHHGYIWAESEPGNGSNFKVLLPAE